MTEQERYENMVDEIIELKNEINRQKEEIDDLFYKLAGVMHSVDKWLDGDELKMI